MTVAWVPLRRLCSRQSAFWWASSVVSALESFIPSLVPEAQAHGLEVEPVEAFVLACIDGQSTVGQLASALGMAPTQLWQVTDRLARRGLLQLSSPQRDTFDAPPKEPGHAPQGSLEQPHVSGVRPVLEGGPPSAQAAELQGAEALELELRRAIVELYQRLDELDHYQLLGVEDGASKAEVKAAYYEAVKRYHPDRYYGKELGHFKAKLERVFQRFTEAHDTLTRKRSREEYDAYLTTLRRNRRTEVLLSHPAPDPAALRALRERLAAESLPPPPVAPRTSPEPPRPAAPPSHPAPAPPPPASQPPLDLKARRQALARRLGGSDALRRASIPPPPAAPRVSPEQATDALRRHFEGQQAARLQRQLGEQERQVSDALQRDDPATALLTLRLLAQLKPEDPALEQRLAAVQHATDVKLADGLLVQADYEERNQRYAEAARSFERAARGKPSVKAFHHAALCLLKTAAPDYRQAARLARCAVELAPNDAELRLTLGRIFLEAGLLQSAEQELQRAAALAPQSEDIKLWLTRLRRS